jgi:SAM-dependent methyltransferase
MPAGAPRNVGEAYDLGAAEYDRRFVADPATVARFQQMERVFESIAQDCDRVLEIGCGTGRVMLKLDARSVVGLDVSAGMLKQARARGLSVVRGDAHALPFANRQFDAVIASNVVFRYLDWPRAFFEAARVLAPEGHLALHMNARSTLALRNLLRPPRDSSTVNDVDRIDDFVAIANRCGFVVRSIELWRSVRLAPYLLRIPVWAPLHLWNHGFFVFQRIPTDTSMHGANVGSRQS